MNPWEVGITVLIILGSVGVIYSVSQWELPMAENSSSRHLLPEWVLLQPQKCAEIPWRKEWVQQNQSDYASFPVNEELPIIQTYYRSRGLTLLDVKLTYQATDSQCTSCGCPESFVYALYVNPEDAARLAASGFTILDTSDPKIFTGPFFRQSQTNPISPVKASECADVFATNTLLDELFGSKKDSCYIQAAITEKNAEVCQNVSSLKANQTCYTEVAVTLKWVDVCQQISSSSAKDSCISSVAGITKDKTLCASINDSSAKYFCELGAGK
jgi:hypothetical protein